MDSPEYNLLERIAVASPSKIHMSHRARRELPLRKVILASRMLDLARQEQSRLMMAEAECIRLIRQQGDDDWWFATEQPPPPQTSISIPTDPETPSALLDTTTLLDTGIIDFESSPLFTSSPAPPPLLDTSALIDAGIIDYQSPLFNNSGEQAQETISTTSSENNTSDWSWLKEDKILEPISASVLLSYIDYDEEEEEEESESEEENNSNNDNNLVVVVNVNSNTTTTTATATTAKDNLLVLFGGEEDEKKKKENCWITIIPPPPPSNTTATIPMTQKKRHHEEDGEEDHVSCKRQLIRT